jgi:hypothetical protein
MSSIAITPGATGTGVFTIAAPSTSTNRTLTLPDSTDTLQTIGGVLTQFNATGSAPVFACRAWVNFNGTNTVAIRASGNVSSITDFGVGTYGVNFTTAMADVNYASVSQAEGTGGAAMRITTSSQYSTTDVVVRTTTLSGVQEDNSTFAVAIFR